MQRSSNTAPEKKRPKSTHLTLRINPEVKKYARIMASREGRSMNDWYNRAVMQLWGMQLANAALLSSGKKSLA